MKRWVLALIACSALGWACLGFDESVTEFCRAHADRCGVDGGPTLVDGGTDAGEGRDAGFDAGVDAGFDAGVDAGTTGTPVNLGSAGRFAILAKTAISTVPNSAVTGDIGVSPAAESFITGFSLTADSTNIFATSAQVTGKVFAASHAPPTPSDLNTAILDMATAFSDASSRPFDFPEVAAGNIGGMTLGPGVYRWETGVQILTDVTLNGSATSVWIFQIAQDLTVDNGRQVFLAGGALAKNVFWQVAGRADLGTTSHLEGVVLSQTSITLRTGASVTGRLLSQTAVSIDASTVVAPGP